MSFASLKFGGELINELSQKIPSSLFALNELIKNSYDAFSPHVTIKISPSKQMITISDRGNGMATDEIKSLFHISKSTKNYGYEIEQDGVKRLTQGSKGLGFLSAFKFGDKVEWVTCKDGVRSSFSVKKSELVSKEDISGVEIPITEDSHIENGTIITIHASKAEIDELLLDLSDEKVSEKLAATIIDESFNIEIEIENKQKIVSTNKLKSFKKENEDSQLFYVKYDSFQEEIEFFHKEELIKSFPFSIDRPDYYSINLELVIFFFQNGKNSKTISNLNKRLHDGVLYPLIYVNNNLFNNMVLFDPDALRKKYSGDTLPQMIGNVCIFSKSEGIEFNSDRTNFVDNNLTKNLAKNLKSLNEFIQVNGAELKKNLKNGGGKVPTGKAVPSSVPEPKNKTALIHIDRKKPTQFFIPSEQIDLEEYIFQVKNSNGEDVDKVKVDIKVDDDFSTSRILNSIEHECEKNIIFRYNDKTTGLVSTEVLFSFEKKISNISGKVQEKSLFTIQSGSEYKIKIETVSDLIFAIDKAYSTRYREEFLPLIACSIRAILEISSDKAFKKHKSLFATFNEQKFSTITRNEVRDGLLKNVVHILTLVKKNAKLRTKISEVLDVNFSTLNNLLDISLFKTVVKNSHVGAHQSIRFLSKPKIENCADLCGLFAVICDVIIHLDNSEISKLNIIKVDESDLNNYFD